MLKKIISGGQTGADFAGLLAGAALGIETGGTAPKGWRIQTYEGREGSDPRLKLFGLTEHKSRDYPPRTRSNAQCSDGTVWFGWEYSPGGKLTIGTCQKHRKPYILNPRSGDLALWIELNRIEVLNIAGNRYSPENPDIEQRVYDYLMQELGGK